MTAKLRRLYQELSRRKVIRVALYYAGAGAAWIGVVVDGGPELGLSEPVISALVWGTVVGFPVALALAWFLKLGREESAPWDSEALDHPEPGLDDQPLHTPTPAAHGIAPPAKGIRVQTLGGIRVFQDGKEITGLPRKPVRCALLAYIAVERNPPKEKALALLWPDKDPELARKSLNQTLTELRKDLGDDWVDSSGPFLIIRDDILTDLAGFQHATREARWEEALRYHGGEFLDGFYLSGSYGFEEWQSQVAGRVKLNQRKAHTRLIEAKHRDGDIPGALGLARNWAEQSPLDDGAQNWYMRLLAEAGQRGAALRHAETFLHRLEQDEEEPLEETLKLIERIKKGEVVESGTPLGTAGAGGKPHDPSDSDESGGSRFLDVAWSHWMKLAFATTLILLAWLIFRPHGPRLESNRVVCFPPGLRGTEEVRSQDVCTALSMALEQMGPITLQEARPYLGAHVPEPGDGLAVEAARAVALDLRAGHFILPSVMAEGDSLYVTLQLFETASNTWVRQSSGSGSLRSASSGQIAARALVELLPNLLDPGRSFDLAFITDRDPGAVALWIEGERFYRNLQFDSAASRLREAVSADSLLAQAALKGAQAASWSHRSGEADSLAQHAVRFLEQLSPREALFAQGLAAYYEGRADAAVRHYREALELDPDWNEAWIGLGETYYHLLPDGVESPEDAERAFRNAIRLDPGFLTPLIHLSEIELRSDDTVGSRLLLERIRSTGVDSTTLRRLTLALECTRQDAPDGFWAEAVQEDPTAVLLAGKDLATAGAHPKCAESAFYTVLSQRPESSGNSDLPFGAAMGLSGILLAQGKGNEARGVLASSYAEGMGALPFVFLVQATVAPELDSLALEIVQLAPSLFGENLERLRFREGWSIAVWEAAHGNVTEVDRYAEGLSRLGRESPGESLKASVAEAVAAHSRLLHADTVAAIRILSSLRMDVPYGEMTWGIHEVMPYERLVLAKALLLTGQHAQAHNVAEVFDHPGPIIFLPFLPESLAVRYQAALAMGWTEIADEYQSRLRKLGRTDLIDAFQPVNREHGGKP